MDSTRTHQLDGMLTRAVSRRQALKALAAVSAGGMGALSRVGTAFADDHGVVVWQPPVIGTPIRGLAFRILTGDDDLRGPLNLVGASQVEASVVIQNEAGEAPVSRPLNGGDEGWSNGSLHDKWFSFGDAGIGTIAVDSVRSFSLRFTPNATGLFGDNWNMNAIEIFYPKGDGLPDPPFTDVLDGNQFDLLALGSGWPWLHRFKERVDDEGGPEFQSVNPGWKMVNAEPDWRWCNQCQGMFFHGNSGTGRCPEGSGGHNFWGSGNYVLFSYAAPVPPGLEDNWRRCNRCEGLVYAGNNLRRPCPAGGDHTPGARNYAMFLGDGVLGSKQGSWRWCNRCQGMFFTGNNTPRLPCPAGGNHDATLIPSARYMVPFSHR